MSSNSWLDYIFRDCDHHFEILRRIDRKDHLALLARWPEAMTQQVILRLKAKMGIPTMLEERRGEVGT